MGDEHNQLETTSIVQPSIRLDSTSNKTSRVDPIILRSTGSTKITLQLNVIDNDEHPECVLEGRIIAERKKHSEDWDESKISLNNIKAGEYYQVILEPSELHHLYCQLSTMYETFSPKDGGYLGSYERFDGTPESVIRFFKTNPYLSFKINGDDEKKHLMELFSKIICDVEADLPINELLSRIDLSSKESVESILKVMTISEELKQTLDNIDLKTLSDIHLIIGVSRLKKIRDTINSNLGCKDEKKWQKFFEENIWVLEQLFSIPMAYLTREADTGIGDIRGSGSNTADFAFKHDISDEIGLIEIKTPQTALIDKPSTPYRNHVYSISREVVDGVSQALRNRYNLLTTHSVKRMMNSADDYSVIQPRCILIVGSYSSIQGNPDHISTFELYRNNLLGVQVITFDELISKIDSIIDLICEEMPETPSESSTDIDR